MIKAVVFDMDGIMFDTERQAHEAMLAVGKELGMPDIETFSVECLGATSASIAVNFAQRYGNASGLNQRRGSISPTKKASTPIPAAIRRNSSSHFPKLMPKGYSHFHFPLYGIFIYFTRASSNLLQE